MRRDRLRGILASFQTLAATPSKIGYCEAGRDRSHLQSPTRELFYPRIVSPDRAAKVAVDRETGFFGKFTLGGLKRVLAFVDLSLGQ